MKILLVPGLGKGLGTGHLRRCLSLASRLGPEACLLVPESGQGCPWNAAEPLSALGYALPVSRLRKVFDAREAWDLVLLDRRATTLEEYAPFARAQVAVGIDEGGKARRYLPFLIDTLPGGAFSHRPNRVSTALLELPGPARRAVAFPFRKLLVSFGGEDPAGLSLSLLKALAACGRSVRGPRGGRMPEPQEETSLRPPVPAAALEITVVEGPLFAAASWPPGVKVLHRPPALKNLLGDYELVFTSYGLTCFEALAAGIPVILLNPSAYHRRLARRLKIPEVGVRRPSRRKLKRFLASPKALEEALNRLRPLLQREGEDARSLLDSLQPRSSALCPACGRALNPVVARFPRRTYFRCEDCGLLYLLGFGGREETYGEEYFSRDYQKRYGRTYLEDFAAIKEAGRPRLRELERVLKPKPGAHLLEVGCAYGPFLQAAAERGYRAVGLDISPAAVRYVRETLGLPCLEGDFLRLEESNLPAGLDALAMWYVIEHLPRLDRALQRANRLLRMGGALAFSTPNGAGLSARKDRLSFLELSPPDHVVVLSPDPASRLLGRFGFQVRRVRITGHHPERFPWVGGHLGKSPLAALFAGLSRVLALGDTFEIYAQKVREL